MNIFVLDTDVNKAAMYHNDAHVRKMIVESAQMLCSAHHLTGGDAPYRLTHKNHPCSIWVRESLPNYEWLSRLMYALYDEFIYRGSKDHLTIKKMAGLLTPNIPNKGLTPFVQTMPDLYKRNDPVEAYRLFYIFEKRGYFVRNKWKESKWTKRGSPFWYL